MPTQDALTMADAGGIAGQFLRGIEKAGNRLPHPFYLFCSLAALIAVASAITAATGASTIDPVTGETVAIRSILGPEGVVYAATSAIENFVTFPPLGLVITVMLGIGLAERVGLLGAAMRGAVLAAPSWAITFVVVLVSMMGNLASDSAAVILPPLAAAAFLAAGRHPLAGFAASYVAVVAGFSANVIVAGTDVLLSGITTEAARIIDPEVVVGPLSNYYFMATSTLVLAVAVTLTCQRFVEPRLAAYTGADLAADRAPLTSRERRGLLAAALAGMLLVAGLVTATLWPGSPLLGEGGTLLNSPFLSAVAIWILLLFVITGVVYGIVAGTLTSADEVPAHMVSSVRDLVPFLVVIFPAAQAIAWFGWSNLGLLIATNGGELLGSAGLDGIGGLLLFSLFVAIPALVLASGSALWALLAPVFVPMFMIAGIDPAFVQAAFRITDSATNAFVPVNPMLPVILGLMQKYEPKAGLGTLFSLIVPFSLVIWVVWLLLFLAWGLLGLPIGPGHSLQL